MLGNTIDFILKAGIAKLHLLFAAVFVILYCESCRERKVKFSALNDKFLGVDQVVLFENGEFYLELGAGEKRESTW